MSFDNFMRRKELWVAVSVAVIAAMSTTLKYRVLVRY